jgi:hypothetical protein
MADLSALTDAINQLTANVQTLIGLVGGTDQPAIDAATTQLQTLDSTVLATINAAPAPAPSPAPAPVPTPAPVVVS